MARTDDDSVPCSDSSCGDAICEEPAVTAEVHEGHAHGAAELHSGQCPVEEDSAAD
jgi:hypothetical protein